MTKTGVAVALLFALSSAVACGDQHAGSESVASTQSAIQGGTADTGHPFAVGVCLDTNPLGGTPAANPDCTTPVSGGQGYYQGICSGALIAPNLVVTARHCVQDTDESIDCNTSVFGAARATAIFVTTDDTFASATHWHTVQTINVPTPTAVCGNDIALLTLADDVPNSEAAPVTPIVQYPMTDHSRYSLRETAIGFGATQAAATNPPGAGTRRILQNIAIECEANDPATAAACTGAFDGGDPIASPNEFFTGDGTCEGDSGSSAYEQKNFDAGIYLTFGVLSRGGQNGTQCVGGVYTRLDVWRDLIVQTVTAAAATGGYSIPTWTQPAPVVPDAGPTVLPGTGQLGDGCSGDPDCASLICRSSTCTQKCDDTNTCPDGYDCESDGFCEATVATNSSTPATTTTTTSSCSCKLAGGPNNPVPWKTSSSLIALGAVMLLRRRRARPSDKS
jgi:hypothetical protein